MPPKPKTLSGQDLVKVFNRFGFEVHSQKGSHIKLRRYSQQGEKQTLTIPNHRELDRGTLLAIFRQATRFIEASRLQPHFYAEK